jgi:predicted nucleotidyltransferase
VTIELEPSGLPTCGRMRVTLDELRAQFVDHPVFAESPTRAKIWASFLRATGMLRDTIPICAIWVGGSFVTAKHDPSDIDVLYIGAAHDYALLHDVGLKRVAIFSRNGSLIERGIPVDCSVLVWEAIPELRPDNPVHIDYLKWRGYWDDFLQRHTDDKSQALTRSNSVPTRGYLEVIDNDFTP